MDLEWKGREEERVRKENGGSRKRRKSRKYFPGGVEEMTGAVMG